MVKFDPVFCSRNGWVWPCIILKIVVFGPCIVLIQLNSGCVIQVITWIHVSIFEKTQLWLCFIIFFCPLSDLSSGPVALHELTRRKLFCWWWISAYRVPFDMSYLSCALWHVLHIVCPFTCLHISQGNMPIYKPFCNFVMLIFKVKYWWLPVKTQNQWACPSSARMNCRWIHCDTLPPYTFPLLSSLEHSCPWKYHIWTNDSG